MNIIIEILKRSFFRFNPKNPFSKGELGVAIIVVVITPFIVNHFHLSYNTERYQKDVGVIVSPTVISEGRDRFLRKQELLKFSVNENVFGIGNSATKYKLIKHAILNGHMAEISFSKHPRASYQEIRSISVDGKSILTQTEHRQGLSKLIILWAILFIYSSVNIFVFIKYLIGKRTTAAATNCLK